MTTQGSSVTAAMAAGSCRRFHLGQDPRLSSRLTERPTPACVSLGKGSVVYDSSFDLFKEIGHLCRLCKAIAGNSELVKPGGAQCLPSGVCGEASSSEGGGTGGTGVQGRTAPRTLMPGRWVSTDTHLLECPHQGGEYANVRVSSRREWARA